MSKTVRIGSGSGFAFDSGVSVPQLLANNPPDYIMFEHLAEGMMSFFARMLEHSPELAFSSTIVDVHLGPNLPALMAAGVKVVTNAGGMNPKGAARAIEKRAAELGLAPKIAVVEGDDVRWLVPELAEAGARDMYNGAPIPAKVAAANAYLGAFPIARALGLGADIVITGRVVDSALVLGPLIHEFGWGPEDYDLLAAGTAVGHLLECGTQSTGGTFTDFLDVPDTDNLGYPIAECRADGSFVITKPEGTGGLVSVGTVSEQLLYEVSDPAAYLVPDVACDFTATRIRQIGPDRVEVSGVRGAAPTGCYKVTVVSEEGWRVPALIPVMGANAVEKARRVVDGVLQRTQRLLDQAGLPTWDELEVDLVGSGESFHVGQGGNSLQTEVIARIAFGHPDVRGATIFRNECIATGTNGSPGTISMGVPPVLARHHLQSLALPRDRLAVTVSMDDQSIVLDAETARPPPAPAHEKAPADLSAGGGDGVVPLIALAWGRSGDKGNLYNLAVIARRPEYLPHIRAALSLEAATEWMRHTFDDVDAAKVERFDVPGIHALNFVFHEALGGGASTQLNLDGNAKTMAQRLLNLPIKVPQELARKWDGTRLTG